MDSFVTLVVSARMSDSDYGDFFFVVVREAQVKIGGKWF